MKLITLLFLSIVASYEEKHPLKVIVHMGVGTLSHIKPLLEMGKVLRARNHTVVYATFDNFEKFNKPYQFPFVALGKFGNDNEQREKMKNDFSVRRKHDPIESIGKNFAITMPAAYDTIYPTLIKVVDDEKPDVIICDFFSSACRDVAEMKGIPLITGFQSTDMLGITRSSFVTEKMTYGSITTDKLNFIERFNDKLLTPLKMMYHFNAMIKAMNKARARHGVPPSSHPFGDFSSSLGLANTFEGLEAAAPLPPNIKMVGPIKSDAYAPLTSELVNFLDIHPRTLYIAFGSSTVLADFDIENLVTGGLIALEEGTIDGILWGLGKTAAEDFPEKLTINGTDISRDDLFSNKHPHIRLLPWAPQPAILEHKNTQLFISHGGLESAVESIFSSTPILCMPFFGDQPRNARKLEDAGVGKYVDRLSVTPSRLASDIKHMLDDNGGMISANVKRMHTIAQFGSHRKELGADTIEEYAYIAQACRPFNPQKYGQVPCELQHLTMASRNMPFVQAKSIDIYSFAILLVMAGLYISAYAARRLASQFSTSLPADEKKDQ